MRLKRIKKYRKKNQGIILSIKLMGIWYCLVVSAVLLTSNTLAGFNDIEIIEGKIHAKWDAPDNAEWDKSSLSFDGTTVVASCEGVYSTIKNSGEDMKTSTWIYYLYEVDDKGNYVGDPKDTGIVPTIKSGYLGEIYSNKVEVNKSYRFMVRRPIGHPAKNNQDENGYTYIQSDNVIKVQPCDAEENKNQQKSIGEEEVKEDQSDTFGDITPGDPKEEQNQQESTNQEAVKEDQSEDPGENTIGDTEE